MITIHYTIRSPWGNLKQRGATPGVVVGCLALAETMWKVWNTHKHFQRAFQIKQHFNKTGNGRITYNGGAFVQLLLQWKSNKDYTTWVCFCSPRYSACSAHAPYFHLWPVRLYNTFSTLSHKRHDCGKKPLIIKYVLIFSTNLSENLLF
jgi:hypothetical protein